MKSPYMIVDKNLVATRKGEASGSYLIFGDSPYAGCFAPARVNSKYLQNRYRLDNPRIKYCCG